ncbi:MAG TPA: YdbH domain-containing protein, partial [Rhizomicrobium sp.]
ARNYFRSHGVDASVEIGALGLSGVSGRFALGPAEAPDFSAERIELRFDPLRWIPFVTEVRLIHPIVRARVTADGKVTLGSLQAWLDSLRQSQGKSSFVSDDLVVSLTGLRALLATPAGAAEVDGDVRLVKNLPASADLALQPANLTWNGLTARVRVGRLNYESSGKVSGHVAADVQGKGFNLNGAEADFKADGLRWSSAPALSVSLTSADLVLSAASANSNRAANTQGNGFAVNDLKADLKARELRWSSSPASVSLTSADLAVSAATANRLRAAALNATIADLTYSGTQAVADLRFDGGLDPTAIVPAPHTGDAPLDRALAANLAHLEVKGAGHLTLRDGRTNITFAAPLEIAGARGGKLSLTHLQLAGGSDRVSAGFQATFGGGGLPNVRAEVKDLLWSGGGFTAHARFNTDFDYAMLRRAALRGDGALLWQNGQYAFTPSGCVHALLAAFHPGASDLAKNVTGDICARPGQSLLTGEGIGWTLTGEARNAAADLPLATAHVEKVAAKLVFDGEGAPRRGTATVTAGQISDNAASPRFKPLLGTGTASLADGVWRGRFAVTDTKKTALGETTFVHTMATGAGTAHIAAPKLSLAPDKLQPEDLSPLLTAFRKADGAVDFSGDVNWTRDTITSRGTLAINSLDFLTPLGRAHAVKTKLEFTSLLPPQTAPGQELTISRIDWTLPFSAVDLRFSFTPASIKVDALASGWAEGHASVMPFVVNLADPGKIAGTAVLQSISLQSLITASNLAGKIKLEGKISAYIPFTLGPEGIRIVNGSIAADGPGRLSVSRSVWVQGEAAISSNAVQDFAYQALENLAFDSLSANLNSVSNGRLQVVFHVTGKSDPPQHQTADVAISDIINGTALYKPIPLPSGTPIDLTLDTSLNFDELLKSYAEAWSKTLTPEGHP